MLIVSVTFKIKPDRFTAFREAVLKNAAASLANEPDCHTFDVCEGKDAVIYLYERYTDDAAFDLHLKSPHFLEFDQQVSDWIESKQVDRYQLVSPA